MSYILEALKKAQAERQLGSAPTIHALPVHASAVEAAGPRRAPVWIGLGILLAASAAFAWYALRAPAAVVAPAAIATAPQAASMPQAVELPPAGAGSAVSAPVSPATTSMPAPMPAPTPKPQAVPFPPAPSPASSSSSPSSPSSPSAPVQAAAPKLAAAKVPASAETPAPEEQLKMLRELPEAVQREVPNVAIGGYIYSKNPADRLLLIDKILRKEGDEVASGLVLEKLTPKGAVMNYRGTRYRVPY